VIIGFVLNCSPFPRTTKSLFLITVDEDFYQRIKELIPPNDKALVYFQKAIHKIIVHAAENILPGYHEFLIDKTIPSITYIGLAELEKQPFSEHKVKQGDRVLIVGKKHYGSYAKYAHLSGKSIVVQLENGEFFNPSPNSVNLVKPKLKIEKVPFSNFAVSPSPDLFIPKSSPVLLPAGGTGNSGGITTLASSGSNEKNLFSMSDLVAVLPQSPQTDSNSSFSKEEDSVTKDYSEVDTLKNEKLPPGNYDFKAEKFRRLSSYPSVEISENLTQEVYLRIRSAKSLSIHMEARNYPEKIKNTNWVSQVNAYMRRKGYNDPRGSYLIIPREISKSYYELWECPGGFDFFEIPQEYSQKK